MTSSLLWVPFAVVALGELGLALAVFGAHVLRRARMRRRSQRAQPARRMVLALAGGDDSVADDLVRLPARTWRAVEPTAVALLSKITGDARAWLIAVFERRGAAARAMRRLKRGSAVRRATAAELLAALRRREAVPYLCGLLSDHDPEVRLVAARSLGQIGDPSAVEPLLDNLDRSELPQQVVAHALMRLGPSGERRLIGALGQADTQARSTAVIVLGLTQALRAVPTVSDLLRHDAVLEVRIQAARALGRLGTRATLPPLLESASPDNPPELRAVAAEALGQVGDAAATTRLSLLLSDPIHRVARSAATALVQLGEPGMAELRMLAGNGMPSARAHAREALAIKALDAAHRAVGVVADSRDEL